MIKKYCISSGTLPSFRIIFRKQNLVFYEAYSHLFYIFYEKYNGNYHIARISIRSVLLIKIYNLRGERVDLQYFHIVRKHIIFLKKLPPFFYSTLEISYILDIRIILYVSVRCSSFFIWDGWRGLRRSPPFIPLSIYRIKVITSIGLFCLLYWSGL